MDKENETILFGSTKRKQTYIELFWGILVGLLLIILQHKSIMNWDIFLKSVLILGFIYFSLNVLDYFILNIVLTSEILIIKSIFTLGKKIKIPLIKIKKVLSISSDYKETNEGYILIFLNKSSCFPIILGPILYINKLKILIQNQKGVI